MFFVLVFVLSAFFISFGVLNDDNEPCFWEWLFDKLRKEKSEE